MQCPVCYNTMESYKTEPCYGRAKGVTYQRQYFRCKMDDTWGQLEVPTGQMTDEEKTAYDQHKAKTSAL